MKLIALFLTLLAAPVWAAAPARPIAGSGCHASLVKDWQGVGEGMARFERMACAQWRPSPYSHAVAPSPDGRAIAVLDGIEGTSWGGFDAEEPHRAANSLSTAATFAGIFADRYSAFRWDDASRTVWSVQQPRLGGGWATGPMRPIRLTAEGKVQLLPPLRHAAGPLDRLLWINGRGLALAQFGSAGSYYRPEHPDPRPTFAFIDAVRGEVLDSTPFPGSHAYDPATAVLRGASTAVLKDGRPTALLLFASAKGSDWYVWTQGERLRRLPDAYPGDNLRTTLTPDGGRVLVARGLSPGMVCSEGGPRRGCYPMGPPVSGPFAALHDLQTGRALWTLTGQAATSIPSIQPAISPDGRVAVIALPATAEHVGLRLGVVRVRDGRMLGSFSLPKYASPQIDFGADARLVVVTVNKTSVFLRLLV